MTDFSNMSKFTGLFIPRSLRPSSIQEILNKRNPPLEELLDNEEFSFELKNCNPRLMDYFTKNTDKVVQLIDYITKMPPDPTDKKRGFKYPFLACEIFEKDIATIINVLFTGSVPLEKNDSAAASSIEDTNSKNTEDKKNESEREERKNQEDNFEKTNSKNQTEIVHEIPKVPLI